MKPSPATSPDGVSRRALLRGAGLGLGSLGLAQLFGCVLPRAGSAPQAAARWAGIVNPPHHPPRVKRVIHLCMAGGPSHLESFDYKPELQRIHGQPFPESFTKGQQLAQLQNKPLNAMGPFCAFRKCGASGLEIAEIFPHLGGVADELCVIKSLHTDQINHDPAHSFMNTGSTIKGRPSMGSWLLYGLGAETEDLPGFVVLTSVGSSGQQPVSARQWSAGLLPSRFQGIQFQSRGNAVHYVGRPDGVSAAAQTATVAEINRLNEMALQERGDPEIETRMRQYDMALRMQASLPELTDWSSEPEAIRELYGVTHPGDGSFASNCLMARRLAERGVRFIQLYHRAWDHHGGIATHMPRSAQDVDRASAALITDLKQRGMLEDTLVLWGGEFGRTPMGQGDGRDHHILGFSVFMAGGGVRGGMSWGATDELGYRAVEDVVHVNDLHATMLHLCGIDHRRLTYRHQGRDFRLTDVAGEVVHGILA
jgi:hypothetical protein